jgi:hypothetical protein
VDGGVKSCGAGDAELDSMVCSFHKNALQFLKGVCVACEVRVERKRQCCLLSTIALKKDCHVTPRPTAPH